MGAHMLMTRLVGVGGTLWVRRLFLWYSFQSVCFIEYSFLTFVTGHGDCECGRCKCDADSLYRGPKCEDCPTCAGQCEGNRACVQCVVHKSGEYNQQECDANCANKTIIIQDEVYGEFFVIVSLEDFCLFNSNRIQNRIVIINCKYQHPLSGRLTSRENYNTYLLSMIACKVALKDLFNKWFICITKKKPHNKLKFHAVFNFIEIVGSNQGQEFGKRLIIVAELLKSQPASFGMSELTLLPSTKDYNNSDHYGFKCNIYET